MERSHLPPLDVVGPDGDRLTLRALDRDSTVGALARSLDVESLWAGRPLAPEERLVEIDEVRVGVRLHALPPGSGTGCNESLRVVPDPGGDAVEVAVVAGPAATRWQRLGPGRHLIGRSPHARVRLDDPAIEPHHALLRIETDGSVDVIQLSGIIPIRVEGRTWDGAFFDDETTFSIGASAIRIRRLGRDTGNNETNVTNENHAESGCVGEPAGSVEVHPSEPWRRVVWRAPHEPAVWSAPTISAPAPPTEPQRPSFTGLIGTAVTAMGAVVIATVMANPMFMLFAAMGAIAATVTFIVGAGSARRRRTRVRATHAEQLDAFSAALDAVRDARRVHHRQHHRTVTETLDEALDGGGRVWQRRLADGPLRGIVGFGTHRWNPPIEIPDRGVLDSSMLQRAERCGQLPGVAAPLTIRPGDAIAFHGPRRSSTAIVRSVVTQLATWVGPADWQLVVVSSNRRTWSWTDWLPHGALDTGALVPLDHAPDEATGPAEVLADALDSIDGTRLTVLVTDEPHLFTTRTGPLRRFLARSNAASLVVVDTEATVPAMCRRVLTVGSTGSASWSGEIADGDDATGIEFVGISLDTADRVARRLSCLIDPEDDGGTGGGLATTVTFSDLFADTTVDAIAGRWRAGGGDPAPSAPVGTSLEGRIDIDLVRDGPHGLIAGTTGAGKSEFLRTLVLGLAASVGPQHLNFVLVDYKGGSTFDACSDLPHTIGLVTDLDDGLAERALVSLEAELHRRERILRSVGAPDLTAYRTHGSKPGESTEAIARLVVVIDEFAALAKELPDFLTALVGIAQRGRSLGVHLLLATQRPAGVVNDDIRANTNLRLALRLHDTADAMDVVGDALPATFPRGLAGRAALRLGPDELVVFQTARCTAPVDVRSSVDGIVVHRSKRPDGSAASGGRELDRPDERSELDVVVEAINRAASALGLHAPHRPWVDPLPFPLAPEDLPDGTGHGTIGCVDDPEQQRRVALNWRPDDGSLALIGSVGSGTTSTLIALAAATCGAARPDELHLYVIDGRGDDGLAALASLAHCGGVVRLTEDERVHRLLDRVVGAIDRRIGPEVASVSTEPRIVVMIDGYGSLRTSLGGIERQVTFDLLHRVVNDGPAVGIALVVADDAGTAITMVPVAHRWLFHVDDPSVARGLGLRSAPVASGRPGRLRILGSGLEAQVARGAPGLAALPSRDDDPAGAAPSVAALPERIGVREIRRDPADADADETPGTSRLQVGVAAVDLGPASIELVDGDHLLVVGGPRSGVSTALARVVAAWEASASRRGEPFRVVRIGRREPVDSRVSAVATDPVTRSAVVIDDAHRVDDPGVLAEVVRGDHPHVTLLVGCRADAVRTSYGHWTRDVARSRCGIVMASRGDPDGDLLGVQIPRRSLVSARPGLVWIVDGGALRQAQVAIDEP